MDISCYQSIKFLFRLTSLIFVFSLLSCSRSSSGTAPVPVSYSVGGTLTGLQGSVTLQNNSADILVLNSAGNFVFQNKLSNGVSYNVVVQSQPVGQSCQVSNASGVINSANVTNIGVVCATAFTLSGSYQIAPLVQVDSDINDSFAVANVNNGSFIGAQLLANFSTVHGFSTLAGTNRALEGDRFANSEDEFDVYRVSLLANQTLRLQVADYAGLDVFQGDLDLYLYDDLGDTIVELSNSVSEFEYITVPADGDYFIVV
ncbi:MAG: hypothetical protein KAT90_00960, partial [Gammaproteobacteria bacterium]|nr:hypothetical protein [Gammaproteobacteria bacterium]